MQTRALQSPHERGKRWLLAKTQQLLADSAVTRPPLRSESDPSCYWGTGPETGTTLYVLLAGHPEPKALPFPRTMIADCGAGLRFSQHNAILWIRRKLKKLGILPA
jgi:hypothetical protein